MVAGGACERPWRKRRQRDVYHLTGSVGLAEDEPVATRVPFPLSRASAPRGPTRMSRRRAPGARLLELRDDRSVDPDDEAAAELTALAPLSVPSTTEDAFKEAKEIGGNDCSPRLLAAIHRDARMKEIVAGRVAPRRKCKTSAHCGAKSIRRGV